MPDQINEFTKTEVKKQILTCTKHLIQLDNARTYINDNYRDYC